MLSAQHFYHVFWKGLDWLFPPNCAGCGREGFRWCPDCQGVTKVVSLPVCDVCGLPRTSTGVCRSCQSSTPAFRSLRSWAVYEGPLQLAMRQLKYHRNMALAESLAQSLSEYSTDLGWKVDLVIPVPLGMERSKERGYNQASLLAFPLAVRNGWRYAPRGLIRIRETSSQVKLSSIQRLDNVHGAFLARPQIVKGRNILIIDDVATTGATLSSCAEALLQGGANVVYALTLARAIPQRGVVNRS